MSKLVSISFLARLIFFIMKSEPTEYKILQKILIKKTKFLEKMGLLLFVDSEISSSFNVGLDCVDFWSHFRKLFFICFEMFLEFNYCELAVFFFKWSEIFTSWLNFFKWILLQKCLIIKSLKNMCFLLFFL